MIIMFWSKPLVSKTWILFTYHSVSFERSKIKSNNEACDFEQTMYDININKTTETENYEYN